jgi:hypothetical protein
MPDSQATLAALAQSMPESQQEVVFDFIHDSDYAPDFDEIHN